MSSKHRLARLVAATAVMVPLGAAACGNDEAVDLDLSAAAQRGQLTAADMGCQGCHTTSGDGGVGPSWDGLYGSTITLSDGSEVTVDDAYIITSVREPNAQKREGQRGAMGAYDEKRISDEELAEIIEYIKALR
ncbi:MAG: cytochrome c [Actinobacteria bacterium]|nr:cytochrome c [Actinomycetota bacterium]